ncbi:hypothetical protein MMC07_009426 [Pseudocyphellaria aurata]|nr:hypothetical protein [Pseudocyphellaria aurata]
MSTLLRILLFLLAVSVAAQNTLTSPVDVARAAATARTNSPTSSVKGKAFDRIAIIWLENTDYDKAIGDPNLKYLATKGITLSNYFGVTHPSEPNYVATIGGEYFGMDNDNFNQIPSNISSVIDLLEDKGISWGHYQEDLPYSGFEGIAWVNQRNGANDYVRKHDPAIIYNSVTNDLNRLANIKNFTLFYSDLQANKLPQWMFITPNMTNDGHDTSVTTAGTWSRNFLTPLLTNPNFASNTLVLLTFDENHTYSARNQVLALLLGDAVPASLTGTVDGGYYNHYSSISTVAANWNLHTLGRWDVGANVFGWVAQKTGDTVRAWTGSPALTSMYFSTSYPGLFNSQNKHVELPVPNTATTWNGRTVLQKIVTTWGGLQSRTYYDTGVKIPDGQHPPVYPP